MKRKQENKNVSEPQLKPYPENVCLICAVVAGAIKVNAAGDMAFRYMRYLPQANILHSAP